MGSPGKKREKRVKLEQGGNRVGYAFPCLLLSCHLKPVEPISQTLLLLPVRPHHAPLVPQSCSISRLLQPRAVPFLPHVSAYFFFFPLCNSFVMSPFRKKFSRYNHTSGLLMVSFLIQTLFRHELYSSYWINK